MGLCPTPQFLFENKIKKKEETSHDDPINNYFYETCITHCSHIPSLGIAAYVGTRVRNKEMSTTSNKLNGGNVMIEAFVSVFVFFVLPIAFLVSLGKGHDETIEGVPPYPKNK